MMHSFSRYFLFHKPYRILSQFSKEGEKRTLAYFLKHLPKDVYPVGRLDYESEGLLLLTNDNTFKTRLLNPGYHYEKEYWVQVEGTVNKEAIALLEKGVAIKVNGKTHLTQKAKVKRIFPDKLPDRNPPIRYRKNVADSWISITLTEGKNRQVRKMTAAVGYPTLRLIRNRIGTLFITGLQPGEVRELSYPEACQAFQKKV